MEQKLFVSLWPNLETFPHFPRFSYDRRLSGIRLNSAMMSAAEWDPAMEVIKAVNPTVPLWFDIKGRQLRVEEVFINNEYLDLTLNHPISVETPTMVLFKAGKDRCLLEKITEGGKRLIFRGGPEKMVYAGESLHIRHPSLKVFGDQFTHHEMEKLTKVKNAGFKRYFLSYVESQRDVDEFRNLVGRDAEIRLKIENLKGLDFVANEFKKEPNVCLVAARGDLFIEVGRPHEILDALKLIIEKDKFACAGSRILLSIIQEPVPSCADLSELAWLHDIGYRELLLCDEICLDEKLLATAVNVWETFHESYAREESILKPIDTRIPTVKRVGSNRSWVRRLIPF